MWEIFITLAAVVALAWPLGRYLAAALGDAPTRIDRVFAPIERFVYRLIGIDARRGMSWRGIALAFVASNAVLAVIVQAILMLQNHLPLNPDGIPGMSWDVALHTMASFLTNTNQQHYSGQAQLSYFSQLAGIVTLQVVTPAMGLAIGLAVLRGLFGGRNVAMAKEGETRDLGNFYVDTVRSVLRVFLPLMLVWSLLLTWQGVPSTFDGAKIAAPIDASAGMKEQVIPVGPVAPMVAIKQLGTNGGGWYGPNSAVPLENPTPLSNLFEIIAILLVPMAIVFMIGRFTRRPKLTWLTLGVMATFSLAFIGAAEWSELQPNAATTGLAANGANMEGKEQRLGPATSALWSTLTTQTSNGSVNAMHDSLNPVAGGIAMAGMLVNAIWGGVGCGLVGFLVYLLVAVFLSGLMIGRTPEIYGRKIEVGEIRLLSLLVLLQPMLILTATAAALSLPALTANSNPGFHGVSQVFYEYASAWANNGSGFEGLGDGTTWWNLSCVVLLLIGRYACLIIPLAVAGRLAAKRVAPVSPGTLDIETPTFALTLIAVIVLLTLLCFLPVLALGPIGEALSLAAHTVS
ncbi:MAG TPA: potassium-transporting ATPase subunit KdpA [Arenimonas sp.]|uniref:potassium-transporting ATPase subunit KdpA n=1 Tax=Arenimonas sp. TaxID=1872635 RepID=UPI002B9ED229|nr:potassium-transporting ATPase subunit KdpA [Arenimonas sp.]HMB56478.1 potassium-transporting ATPase subunit KdpA [Arenimonas sp.]